MLAVIQRVNADGPLSRVTRSKCAETSGQCQHATACAHMVLSLDKMACEMPTTARCNQPWLAALLNDTLACSSNFTTPTECRVEAYDVHAPTYATQMSAQVHGGAKHQPWCSPAMM
jgi:hypothetical protein